MSPFVFRPRVTELEGRPDMDRLVAALGGLPGAAILDSAGGLPRRWSLLAFEPLGGALPPADPAGLEVYVAQLARDPEARPVPGPFAGGFLGAIAYDLGVAGENLDLPTPPEGWRFPGIVGGLYTDFVVVDHGGEHGEERAFLVLGEDPGDDRPSVEERHDRILERLARDPERGPATPRGDLVRSVPTREHEARVERVREFIAEGEIYQANVAHRFTREMAGSPLAIYLRLRRDNPAPYAAYLAFEGGALLSASPELLLDYDGHRARTRPIKGTIARAADPTEDRRQREALLASEKDIAELAMIVDLERNDLGRVAVPGTVRTDGFPSLESYAAVHHLVADVSCEPLPGIGAPGLLAALFPGGSITGAPKLRSMEVIAELEGEGRGFFTGSLGFLDTLGRATFNILIRTLVWRPLPDGKGDEEDRGEEGEAGEVSFHVGGGITWSSDPSGEERETLYKGAALAAALCAEGESDPLAALVPKTKGTMATKVPKS